MPDFSQLPDNPFVRLRALLAGVEPEMPVIDLGIGEPRHPVPRFVIEVLGREPELYGRYPPTDGTPEFRLAAAQIGSRAASNLPGGFIDAERQIMPVNGTREALFLAAFLAKDGQGQARGADPQSVLSSLCGGGDRHRRRAGLCAGDGGEESSAGFRRALA